MVTVQNMNSMESDARRLAQDNVAYKVVLAHHLHHRPPMSISCQHSMGKLSYHILLNYNLLVPAQYDPFPPLNYHRKP